MAILAFCLLLVIPIQAQSIGFCDNCESQYLLDVVYISVVIVFVAWLHAQPRVRYKLHRQISLSPGFVIITTNEANNTYWSILFSFPSITNELELLETRSQSILIYIHVVPYISLRTCALCVWLCVLDCFAISEGRSEGVPTLPMILHKARMTGQRRADAGTTGRANPWLLTVFSDKYSKLGH